MADDPYWRDIISFDSSNNSVVFKGRHDFPRQSEFQLELSFNDSAKTLLKFNFVIVRENELVVEKISAKEQKRVAKWATRSTEKPILKEPIKTITVAPGETKSLILPGVAEIINIDGSK